MKQEKELKTKIKTSSAALQVKTKETIETLSDDDVYSLLERKWIDTLCGNLAKLPDTIVDSLVSEISALQAKYATTFFEVEQEIRETERSLAALIDELEGGDFDMKGLDEFKKLLGGVQNG